VVAGAVEEVVGWKTVTEEVCPIVFNVLSIVVHIITIFGTLPFLL
jgi:hypothetical protein